MDSELMFSTLDASMERSVHHAPGKWVGMMLHKPKQELSRFNRLGGIKVSKFRGISLCRRDSISTSPRG